jgi:hypothetical protein
MSLKFSEVVKGCATLVAIVAVASDVGRPLRAAGWIRNNAGLPLLTHIGIFNFRVLQCPAL